METLYFLSYNNYYNRIVKRENDISGYTQYLIGAPITGVSFKYGDGLSTSQVLNWEYETPDYCIVQDENGGLTRWFVIEATRNRAKQYTVQLYRDTIADYYDDLMDAPCFIEKATVQSDDPAIYNSENMTFNQIKTTETQLKDKSGCAWLVGYFARTDGTGYTTMDGTITTAANADFVVNGPISQFEYYEYLNKDLYMNPSYIYYYFYSKVKTSSSATATDSADFFFNGITQENRGGLEGYDLEYDTNLFFTPSSYPGDTQVRSYIVSHLGEINDAIGTLAGFSTEEQTSEIMNLNGKVVQYEENGQIKFSRLNLVDTGKYEQAGGIIRSASQGSAFTTIKGILNGIGCNTSASDWGDEGFSYSYRANRYRIELENVEESEFEYTIDDNRIHPSDAPFDIFAVPYGDNIIIDNVDDYDGGRITLQPSKSLMLNLVTELAAQQGSKVYDVQLLPYCPWQGLITDEGHIDVSSLNRRTANGAISYANFYRRSAGTATTAVGVILLPPQSSFTLNIELDTPITITEPKVQALCDMYRLVSPNYSGQFEFNAAKNSGVSWFNVDCTYLPYNPYIHINPNFQNLYGADFNDARGLICTGDFSISIVTDQWAQYQISNKNYQQIFNRQIQNMEFNNRIAGAQDVLGAMTGATTGALAGGVMGGPGGAVAGGAMSFIGGLADVGLNNAIRNETLDYTKDMFGYQLGNIKALPDSIAKTTAFTYNNKIFPILEYYTCTDVEKQALRDKCYYNGMTIMRIGTIGEFKLTEPSYIKGKLIRMESLQDDFHMLNAIASEMNKGVFI